MELSGAHVVITGGSRGIGAAMARSFAAAGSQVTLVARSVDKIDQLATELRGHAIPADLLDRSQVDALVPKIEGAIGPIDVLVNNAGIETLSWFESLPVDQLRDLAVLNFETPMMLTRAVLSGMLDRDRGHLVYTSSAAGTGGFPGMTAYGATKAGITNFVAGLRMELRDTAVHTTVVAPGPVDTDMLDRIEAADAMAPVLKRLRLLQVLPTLSPEKVARKTVAAVSADRRHVRLPRRLVLGHMLREAPTRVTEAALRGVPVGRQAKTDAC